MLLQIKSNRQTVGTITPPQSALTFVSMICPSHAVLQYPEYHQSNPHIHSSNMDISSSDAQCYRPESHRSPAASISPPLMRLSDFSIDHILHRAGQSIQRRQQFRSHEPEDFCAPAEAATPPIMGNQLLDVPMFNWLQYSRYHPPRPQKSLSKSGNANGMPARRTPGRLPRVPFSAAQLSALEAAYRRSTYLSSEDANRLADRLALTSTRVKIWFQNRRARERRERREQQPDGEVCPADGQQQVTSTSLAVVAGLSGGVEDCWYAVDLVRK